jgi:isopenicillin N synthase-like dioxygenase
MTTRDRYSIPFFFNPAVDAVIEPIPELCDDAPAYRPFAWGEFIAARVSDNYADLGAEDTQVSHFRVPAHG